MRCPSSLSVWKTEGKVTPLPEKKKTPYLSFDLEGTSAFFEIVARC